MSTTSILLKSDVFNISHLGPGSPLAVLLDLGATVTTLYRHIRILPGHSLLEDFHLHAALLSHLCQIQL